MLEGDLYEVLEKTDVAALVRTLPGSSIYGAHFPGYSITPGVGLVQMALDLMGKELVSAKDIKFVQPVFPGALVRFEWTEDGAVHVFLEADGSLCAKMNLLCR
ncbi:MAG: hypothetical protein J6M31_01475 [Bacteroidales bacterium]|nr:hypothetical protein [Bacteroidales bacterium]